MLHLLQVEEVFAESYDDNTAEFRNVEQRVEDEENNYSVKVGLSVTKTRL